MTKLRSTLKWLYLLLLLPGSMALSAWQAHQWWHWSISPIAARPEGSSAPELIQVEIPQNTSTREIGEDLVATGLIRSAWAWNLWASYLSLQDKSGSFKAGTYQLSPQSDMKAIAQRVWLGEVADQSFTIPEGQSLAQMGAYFARRGYFSEQAWQTATQEIPRDRFPWLPENITNLEGFLYPDTYTIAAGQTVTPTEVINLMLARFAAIALPLYEAQTTDFSLLEWVTLGSMVEKEAAIASERPLIAGVFIKRLNENMRLESDPTVEYFSGIQQTPGQPLTLEQVQQPHPYNTYLNPGLPPGPISSPGQDSLEAVLNPEITDYLYFVANNDGTHVFSTTLEEHEAAKAAIQEAMQSDGEG